MNWGGLSVAVGLVVVALSAPPWGFLLVVAIVAGIALWAKMQKPK